MLLHSYSTVHKLSVFCFNGSKGPNIAHGYNDRSSNIPNDLTLTKISLMSMGHKRRKTLRSPWDFIRQ